jgi:hypothetical protein
MYPGIKPQEFKIILNKDYYQPRWVLEDPPESTLLQIISGPEQTSWQKEHYSKRYIFSEPRLYTEYGWQYEVKKNNRK